jgi:hypothetical protein
MDMPEGANVAVPGNYSLVQSSLSNKGNPTASGFDNMMLVEESQEIRLVDSGGNILFSGIGSDAARQAVAIGDSLSKEYGDNAGWKIQQGQKIEGPNGGIGQIRWDTMAKEKVNVDVGAMVLNAAVQIGVAVATSGMSIPAQAAISAGASAAMVVAQGGSLGDALKAGVMAAAPTVGAAYLGPMVQAGTNAAGKVVATTLGKAVAAGASSTTMGLITGQSIENALASGAISAAGQVLAAELASKSPGEVSDMLKNADLDAISLDAMDAVDSISSALTKEFAANGITAANLGPGVMNTVSRVGTGIENIIATAPRAAATATANAASNAVAGLANAVQQTIPTGNGRDIEVNAQEQPAPLYEVDPAAAVGGIGSVITQDLINQATAEDAQLANEDEDIIATAQRDAAAINAANVATPGLANLTPEIIATAQRDAATTTEETTTPAVTGDFLPDLTSTGQRDTVTQTDETTAGGIGGEFLPDLTSTAPRDAAVNDDNAPLSVNMTDIGDLINSDDFQKEIAEEEADKDDKSILDIAKDAAQIVGAVATVAGAVTAGGGGGGGGGGDNGPGITFNPTVLTPTVGGPGGVGGIGGAGSRYPYTPTTYGRVGGDQETEYEFFTRAPATPPAAGPVTAAAGPVVSGTAPGKKAGGEIHDDMVKHLVEYRKGGGHQGPGKVTGIGSGQEDLIPAWLSDGEYVWSAQDVADLGDGSTDEGVRRLDKMRQMVRRQAGRKDVKKIAKPQKGIDTMLKAVGGLV